MDTLFGFPLVLSVHAPTDRILQIENGSMLVHPEMANRLRDLLATDQQDRVLDLVQNRETPFPPERRVGVIEAAQMRLDRVRMIVRTEMDAAFYVGRATSIGNMVPAQLMPDETLPGIRDFRYTLVGDIRMEPDNPAACAVMSDGVEPPVRGIMLRE